jgi:hypothetical protein
LAKVVEDESLHSNDDDDQFDARGGGGGGGGGRNQRNNNSNNFNNSRGNIDFDPRRRDLPFDRDTDDELSLAANQQQQLIRPMVSPISLILLLVCPDTLRFELLRLEFETPQDMIVADVLDQLENSVMEKSLQRLTFTALVDSKGMAHQGKDPLAMP